MSDQITCPRCAMSFEPSARLRAEIEASVQARLDGDAAAKEAALLRRTRELDDRERRAAVTLEEKLAAAAPALRASADADAEVRHRARADQRMREMQAQLATATAIATAASTKEAELLRRARELDDRERDHALAFERRLADELPKIHARAQAQAHEQGAIEREAAELRVQEQRLKAEQLEKTIEALQRQVRQGSQQLQGEAQEASLRELLAAAFVFDDIADVPTGVRGADLLQRVRDTAGTDCGTIIWESKRTRAWSDGWLGKLRDDQRATGAVCAVIVTQALPAGVTHFAQIGGTWVCAWPYAAALATVLRSGLGELAGARLAAGNRGEKAELLYDYLTGPEFRNRVGGVLEALAEMQDDLAQERRAMERLWKQREKQLLRAHQNLGAFYGDLRGIAGRKLAVLEELELPGGPRADRGALPTVAPAGAAPEFVDDDDSAQIGLDATAPPELVGLLYSLLPESGEPADAQSLFTSFVRAATATLGLRVGDADFARCRDVLVDRGMVRRGKGRNGGLARRLTSTTGPLFSPRS